MNFLKREEGNVIVIVAIAMVVLIALAALGIDSGYLFYRHTQLQDYADSLALAAGHDYDGTSLDSAVNGAAKNAAANELTWTTVSSGKANVSTKNGESGTAEVSIDSTDGGVRVNLDLNYSLFFAKIYGSNTTPVVASAKVGKAFLTSYSGKDIIPVGVVEDKTYTTTDSEGKPVDISITYKSGERNEFYIQ